MTTLRRSLAVAAALALAAPALPAAAQPAPTRVTAGEPPTPPAPSKAQQQEAATRFKKGLEAFKDGDYQAALVEFRRAYELAPNYNVLYNIGQVYFQLQDYPGALGALERYLSEGGTSVPSARRGDVQRDIEKLKARVANLEIATTVPGADVSIDDVPVGKSPLPKPILVNAGRHKVTVSRAGFTAATKVVEIASGDLLEVLVELVEPAPQVHPGERPGPVEPPPPVVEAPPALPPHAARFVPVPGVVVTSGLVLGAVATGILALDASSTLKSDRGSSTATHDLLTGDASKTTALALTSDILTGGAVIALGVTLYVGLSGKKEAPPASPAGRITQLRIAVGGTSLRLTGAF